MAQTGAPTLIRGLTLVSPDFDNSGSVDFDDFLAFGAAFGKRNPAFDLTGDGNVDFHDFLSFVQAFKESE
jgi:Ca2+-binding EF-hand superfamily protein